MGFIRYSANVENMVSS